MKVYGMALLVFSFYNTDHIQVEFDKSSSNSKYGGLSSTTLLILIKNTCICEEMLAY
jgi:hypothetical protein